MAIPPIPEVRDLMEAGVHFGHASGKWHPKMKPYIFATRDKLHIIDLEQTRIHLEKVLTILEQYIASGKVVVLVGTKKQVTNQVREIGERLHIPYVCERWLGGTMTNWGEMQQSIARMKRMEGQLENEETAAKMIKKERVMMQSELKRMHAKFSGLRDMAKKPDALFIIDPSHEHNAVKEALHQGIEIFAVVDTNTDPTPVNYLIPANDDGPKSVALLMDLISQTIESGQKMITAAKEKEAKAAEKAEMAETETTVVLPEDVVAEVEVIEEKEEKAKAAAPKPAAKAAKKEVKTEKE
jgi:small subunit ribosomal protein S2